MRSDLRSIKAVDAVLLLAILASSAHLIRFLGLGYSPTRTVFLTYLVVAVAGFGLVRRGRLTRIAVAILALLGVVFLGYLLWLPSVGSWISVNLWNEWSLAFALLLYAYVYGAQRWTVWRSLFIVLGLTAAALQLVGIVFFRSMLIKNHGAWGPADFYGMRSVHANVAMLMVIGLVCALYHPRLTVRIRVIFAVFLALSVMLAQWRTVWIALVMALVLASVTALQRRGPRGLRQAVAWSWGLVGAIVLLPVLTGFSVLPGNATTEVAGVQLPDSVTSSGTLGWRLDMWQSRLTAPRSWGETLFGGILGTDNLVYPGDGIMNGNMSGHNVFVDLYTVSGLLGLGIVIALMVTAFRMRRWQLDEITIGLASATVFGLSFFWPPWLWITLGVALSQAPAAVAASTPKAAAVKKVSP